MAQDLTSLYNLALSAVGATVRISLPTEASFEAETCQLWFPVVRDMVIGSARWPSVKGVKRLALAGTRDTDASWVSTDPAPGWLYTYAAPDKMVRPWFLTTYARFETGVNEAEVPTIDTDQAEAILVYSRRITNLQVWNASLYLATAYALAAHIAMPLTGKASRTDNLIKEARSIAEATNVAAANEGEQRVDSLPEGLQARGYGGGRSLTRYLYPMDSIRVMTGAPLE